jgi:hypothetical protein
MNVGAYAGIASCHSPMAVSQSRGQRDAGGGARVVSVYQPK